MSFTEIYTFLCSISLVRFLSTLYLWPILFTLGWKTNSHLVFLIHKKLKRTGLAATVIGHFSGILRIHSSSISAYSWRLKENTSFPESKKPFVIHSLSIYYCSSTGERERAEYIGTGDEKDQFDIVMQTSSNNLGLTVFKSTFRRVMPFLVFLGRGQNVLLCFLMDLTSPTTGINNEWSLNGTFFSWESLNN